MTWQGSLLGLAAALALFTVAWLVSLAKRDASVADVFWGAGFALLAALWWARADEPTVRAGLVAAAVALWALRLSGHIAWRNHGEPEDRRYRAMRENAGGSFWWRSLVTVFWLQAAILWVVATPVFAAVAEPAPRTLSTLDLAGLGVFLAGFAWESLADLQLARFKADPANEGKVMDRGLWKYSRHPNYFGEAVLWWGLWLPAVAVGAWWTAIGPALITFLLLRVSGVTLLEEDLRDRKPEYAQYVRRTNAFVPGPPKG